MARRGAARPQLTEAQRAQTRAEFDKTRESTDQLREPALALLHKSLRKKQGAAFKKLLGEPFDLS